MLSQYGQSGSFRRLRAESKRNYATDTAILLTFLWSRGKSWLDATAKDLDDFENWRTNAAANPRRIGGSKWNRELAAFTRLYKWAKREGYVSQNPVEVMGGAQVRAADSADANVHWLTPRTWRLWTNVGLRGHGCDGVPRPGWPGRLEDRNTAFVHLLTSSGLRRQEAASLLTLEVPSAPLSGGRYWPSRVAGAVTRSKSSRTFYASSEAVGNIESYTVSSRAWAVQQAQRASRYDGLPMRMLTEITRGPKHTAVWRELDGTVGRLELSRMAVAERLTLFTEGPDGPEPLWLWLNEQGLPFLPHSWNGVFRTANQRCAQVLAPPDAARKTDPHRVWAPYATPHSTRHSFALFMLVVLNEVMDRRYGLSPAERRDFRLLYGDPWFLVQGLLGHKSRQTTVDHYLAPVRHLQLASLLGSAQQPLSEPLPDLDGVFARVASDSVGIQDIDVRMSASE
ncbi:site-specific integrase [Streptomyces sp. NPDC005071]